MDVLQECCQGWFIQRDGQVLATVVSLLAFDQLVVPELRELGPQRVARRVQPLAGRLETFVRRYQAVAAQGQQRRGDPSRDQRVALEIGLGGPPTRERLLGIKVRMQHSVKLRSSGIEVVTKLSDAGIHVFHS